MRHWLLWWVQNRASPLMSIFSPGPVCVVCVRQVTTVGVPWTPPHPSRFSTTCSVSCPRVPPRGAPPERGCGFSEHWYRNRDFLCRHAYLSTWASTVAEVCVVAVACSFEGELRSSDPGCVGCCSRPQTAKKFQAFPPPFGPRTFSSLFSFLFPHFQL